MKKNQIAICIVLVALMVGYFSVSLSNHLILTRSKMEPAKAAEFLKFGIPAVTHGFEKSQTLPDGDLFLLPTPITMALSDPPEGAEVFPVNVDSFGGDGVAVGALSGVQPMGFSLSTAGTKVRALTCSESIWDGNLLIAATSGAEGDTVRLFLQLPDGQAGPELVLFTIKAGGLEVTGLHSELMLFINNRFAKGPSWEKGTYIPFAAPAGTSGFRTDLLTLAWPMGFFSPLQGCFRVGVEIARSNSPGTTSVVFTDLVVNRNRAPGDENNQGFGLLGRLTGGFPTGLPCKAECPFPTPSPGTATPERCSTICFRSPQYYLLNLDHLPHGMVLVGGMNFNNPISTTDKRAMSAALRGGSSPLQQLNEEFVAAQLNVLNAGGEGSPQIFYAMGGKLKCYGLDFEPITISNGFVVTPETKLQDLFSQCRISIRLNQPEDLLTLARILDMLNGNIPLNHCNSAR